MNKPKVVFTFVEAGMGHIVPATGLSDAFEKKYGDKCEVVRSYIFKDSKSEIVREYGKELIGHTKKASVNPIYAQVERLSYLVGSKFSLKVLDRKFKKAKEIVMDELKELNPDLICSTYYSPSHFAIEARKKGLIDPIVVTYTPDPVVYPAWDRDGDIYMVNNESAHRLAIKHGFKKETIRQIPFILREDIFDVSRDKATVRRELGLPEDKFTVVIANGAYGVGKSKKIVQGLLDKNLDMTVVCICGMNKELLEEFEEIKKNYKGNVHFEPIGFTNRMLKYNSASNLFLGKSGANALVESFYFNVPAIVVSHTNILEKSICKFYIKELKCGKKIYNIKKIINAVVDYYNNPEKLHEFDEGLKKLQDNTGAEKGADIIFEALTKKFPELK